MRRKRHARIATAALLCAAALLVGVIAAAAQVAPVKYSSAATNNATLVKAGRMSVGLVSVVNSTATPYYLKLYDKATAPTCGTDVPKLVLAVPPIALGGNASVPIGQRVNVGLGIGFCLVAGVADNDNTSAATGVIINIGFTSQ